MATKKSTAVAKPAVSTSRAVAAPGSWRERAAASVSRAQAVASTLPAQSGNFLSFQGGNITHGGVQLANPLPVVILAVAFERSYYSKDYQPGNAATPDCYSYESGDDAVPHPDAKVPQADKCKDCRFNEFGSARTGAGKGCKEGAKIALLHADSIETPAMIAEAPIVSGRLSVLNAKTLRSYINGLGDQPIWMDVTQLKNRPDGKSQYAVSFTRENVALDDAILDAIAAREEEALKLLETPYPDIEERQPAQRVAPARKSRFQK